MEVISTKLRDQRRLEFSKLFNPESHRNEVIATFLALLNCCVCAIRSSRTPRFTKF